MKKVKRNEPPNSLNSDQVPAVASASQSVPSTLALVTNVQASQTTEPQTQGVSATACSAINKKYDVSNVTLSGRFHFDHLRNPKHKTDTLVEYVQGVQGEPIIKLIYEEDSNDEDDSEPKHIMADISRIENG